MALTLAASASIAQAGLDRTDTGLAIATFVAIGSATVVGSVVFYRAAPGWAEQPLAAIKQFMAMNNAVIMVIVLLILVAKFRGGGLSPPTSSPLPRRRPWTSPVPTRLRSPPPNLGRPRRG